MVKIAFLGDINLAGIVGKKILENGPEYPWGNTLRVLKEADLRIANLECAISDKGTMHGNKVFCFRAPPEAVDSLNTAGIDYVSLANNHTLDYREEALFDTMQRLERGSIKYAGAGRNRSEAAEPAFVESKGLKVGITSFTNNMPSWAAKDDKPGVNFMRVWPGRSIFKYMESLAFWPITMGAVRKSLQAARLKSDLTVFSAHWGPNFLERPTPLFRYFARQVMENGADIFHGHSAHILQGMSFWKGKPILFDTGDFVDDYRVTAFRNDWSFVYMLDLDKNTVALYPILISGCQANLAKGKTADQIIGRMVSLCSEMGTRTEVQDQKVIISP